MTVAWRRYVFYAMLAVAAKASEPGDWTGTMKAGESLHKSGKWSEALVVYKDALKLAEKEGAQTDHVVMSMNGLGALAQDMGDMSVAEHWYLHAREIWTSLHGALNEPSAELLAGVITAELYAGQISKAEKNAAEGLKIAEALGDDSAVAAKMVHLAASVAEKKGDNVQAGRLYARAIALAVHRTDEVFLVGVHSMNNLALLHKAERRFDLAEADFRSAIALIEERISKESPELIIPLAGLGLVHWKQGRLPSASEALERARTIAERSLAPESPLLGHVLVDCSVVARERKDKVRAKALEKRGREILARNAGTLAAQSVIDIKSFNAGQR